MMDNVKLGIDQFTLFQRRAQLFLAKGPVYHATYGRWRLANWLQKTLVRSFNFDNASFLSEIALEKLALAEIEGSGSKGNLDNILVSLTAHLRSRMIPIFFFGQEDKDKLLMLIRKAEMEATIQAAEEIRENVFNFRRVGPVEFKDGIDWTYRPEGNTDWTWDLNRHTCFEILGRAYWYTDDERYAQKFRELLLDWLANNPAKVGQSNWASVFEVAFRINTWLWAFYYFRSAPVFDDETCLAFLKGLLAHGCYLDANLELHVQNNHLLLEAKALAMLGILFPEFKRAERWLQRGLKMLYQQVEAQVCSDGVHGERATHYHRVIAGELLELLVLLDDNNMSIPPKILQSFNQMVEFELWITKPDGVIPLFGDSALEDTHLRFSAASGGVAFLARRDLKSVASPLDEADIWLLGPRRVEQYLKVPAVDSNLASRAFPEGGYYVMRSGSGLEAAYLVFDCGPFGYKPTPNHGHADALSFELYAYGQTLLVDPGVYSTHLGHDWRNFFRGSRAHNTVVVDNKDQSILLDTQRVYRPAQVTLHQWISNDQFDFVEGSHNGYERLSEPITHLRQIFFVKPEYWVVIDKLLGRGKHSFDLYFHLMPGNEVQMDSPTKSLRVGNRIETRVTIVPLVSGNLQAEAITGTTAPIQGWVSFFSGEKLAAPTVRYHQELEAPVQFCTILYPHADGKQTTVQVSALDIELEERTVTRANGLTACAIETDRYVDYLVIDLSGKKVNKIFAEYESNAQLLYLRQRRESHELIRAITWGEGQVLFQGQPLLDGSIFRKVS